MASGAFQALMRSGEREIRLRIMNKSPQRPTARIVTIGALLTKAALMDVILGVTGAACRVSGPEVLADVARAARDGLVLAQKRKVAEIMIEAQICRP